MCNSDILYIAFVHDLCDFDNDFFLRTVNDILFYFALHAKWYLVRCVDMNLGILESGKG